MASSHSRYSGLSTFTKLALHQTMNNWPTFSSTLRVCSVFSAHLSPRVVLMGAEGLAFLSLSFSLANVGRASATTRRIAEKIRGMKGTIAEVRAASVRLRASGSQSSFDTGDCFTPNHGIFTESLLPCDFRLAAEPRQLPLCIVAMGLLCGLQGLIAGQFSTQQLNRLFVSERRQRARRCPVLFL